MTKTQTRLAGSNLDGSAKTRPVAETPMTPAQVADLTTLLDAAAPAAWELIETGFGGLPMSMLRRTSV